MQRKSGAKRRGPVRRVLRALLLLACGLALASVLVVLALRWLPPPRTAFMLAAASGPDAVAIDYRWRAWDDLSPELAIAVVASEDQRFPHHAGFDFAAIRAVLADDGAPRRGASTISQQVAKNLFLWSGRSWLRKGIEVWFTMLIELIWPKRRILEVYLNVAEFGPGIYGAEAAAQRFYRKPARALSLREAARLAAVLPNPRRLDAARPSRYVWGRVSWIERQVRQLGGVDYLGSPPPARKAR
jgi:monofunctional biosynthetic peptidoglycan transglycosylase